MPHQSLKRASVAASLVIAASTAWAGPVALNFEGIAPYPNASDVFVRDFYNGGTSSIGTTGTNYGISFGGNALLICLNTASVACPSSNTSHGGLGDPNSLQSGLFFLTGTQTFMNVAAGFDTGFSFNYTAPFEAGIVNVFDGLDGTGNILATLDLSTTASNCAPVFGALFCPFVAAGVQFNGIARSVGFGGVSNEVTFDDITIGSSTPGGQVPEPASLALVGLALAGAWASRHRVTAA